MKNSRLARLGLLLILLAACAREKVLEEADGWSYRMINVREGFAVREEYHLSFHGREPSAQGRLVTPFGVLVLIARTDKASSSGWKRFGGPRSTLFPEVGAPLAPDDLKRGYYPSVAGKRPGTPGSWFFVVDSITPGWFSPERLLETNANQLVYKHRPDVWQQVRQVDSSTGSFR